MTVLCFILQNVSQQNLISVSPCKLHSSLPPTQRFLALSRPISSRKLSNESCLTVAISTLSSQQMALIAVRMACNCFLKTRHSVLLNVSLIVSLLAAYSYSLQSLCLCRVEVPKFVHLSADAKGFAFLDFRQKQQHIASFSYRNHV